MTLYFKYLLYLGNYKLLYIIHYIDDYSTPTSITSTFQGPRVPLSTDKIEGLKLCNVQRCKFKSMQDGALWKMVHHFIFRILIFFSFFFSIDHITKAKVFRLSLLSWTQQVVLSSLLTSNMPVLSPPSVKFNLLS